MSTIEIRNLSKRYGKVQALKNVSITFSPEKIYGFLGRNGAGKTTLLNILTNRIFSDQGEVLVDGESAVENDRVQEKIFYMTEKNLYPIETKVMNAYKLTRDFYPAFDLEEARRLSEKFELETAKKIEALSTGFKSIFKMILTLSANTPILLFDEPVLGLDANHREMFYKELIAHYSAHPKTVVLSTHLIGEIADLLEDVVIIKAGEILLSQPVEQVLQLAYTVSGVQENVDRYAQGKPVLREESLGRYKASTIFQKWDGLDREAISGLGLEVTSPKLQELFISLTSS
jgi:ABC-2 type transport system ATP-binding protein